MQDRHKSKLYKKLFICSLIVFIVGFLVVVVSVLKDYGIANRCASNACPGVSIHGGIPKIGSYVAAVGFYASLVFSVLLLFARSKEK